MNHDSDGGYFWRINCTTPKEIERETIFLISIYAHFCLFLKFESNEIKDN